MQGKSEQTPEPAPPFSLSNALVTLAAPVLSKRSGIEEIETAVLAAAAVWNASRADASPREQAAGLREAESLIADLPGDSRSAKKRVRGMYRAARKRYADIERRVVDVRVQAGKDRTAHVQVAATVGANEDADALADPEWKAVADRFTSLVDGCPAATVVARRHAIQALVLFRQLEPAAFERGGPDVWVAASLHAALQKLPPPRLTISKLAGLFGVNEGPLSRASLALRRTVDWDLIRHAGHPLARLAVAFEHQQAASAAGGGDSDGGEPNGSANGGDSNGCVPDGSEPDAASSLREQPLRAPSAAPSADGKSFAGPSAGEKPLSTDQMELFRL